MPSDVDILHEMGTDAQKWAKEYIRVIEENPHSTDPTDEYFLFTWFANAIEAGRSVGYIEGRRAAVEEIEEGIQQTRKRFGLLDV